MRPLPVGPAVCALVLSLASSLPAAPPAVEPVDLDAVTRIRDEAFQRSQVMGVVEHLTDHIGSRLTGSSQVRQASEWTQKRLVQWGLANAHLEAWGPFGRGWVVERCVVSLRAPAPAPLVALPRAYSVGTNGPVRGVAVRVRLESEADLEEQRGKLKGRILLLRGLREIKPDTRPPFQRYTDADLRDLERFDIAEETTARVQNREAFVRRYKFGKALRAFLAREGVLATLEPSSADAGILRVGGNGASWSAGDTPGVPALVVASDHYNRLVRLAESGTPPELEIDVRARFTEAEGPEKNTLAEIPGSDLRAEVVMMGAHLDSWHGSTGATDNAAGAAVVMEAARILQATGLRPRRTIRLALWTGEEQGLLGSESYVREHFAVRGPGATPPDPDLPPSLQSERGPLQVKPDHARLSGYFNIDDGTGRIRGIYGEGNAAIVPIFNAWLAPLHDLGVESVTLRHSGGSDHEAFDDAGLPGFIFMQDRAEYDERTHHTNIDDFDRVSRTDLMQASAVLATIVYHAAMRDALLPRKPLPR